MEDFFQKHGLIIILLTNITKFIYKLYFEFYQDYTTFAFLTGYSAKGGGLEFLMYNTNASKVGCVGLRQSFVAGQLLSCFQQTPS